ncbi:MAG: FAD-dependent oxidoreductase [Ilumatobacteraceae bacterium]
MLPADVAEEARHSERLGVSVRFEGADWAAIRDRVFGRIDPIAAGGKEYRATGSANISLIEGTARFVGERELDVEGRRITAQHILIAAGSRPTIPPIDGLAETGFHTSDSIMRLDDLPPRLGIIGGGFIAVEMGHVFAGLGAQVTIFNRSHTLLRQHDEEIAARFTEIFGARDNVELHLGHLPNLVERRDDGIVVHCAGEEVVVDELLVATGREPNSDLLDVDRGGLVCRRHGTIEVDEFQRTGVDGVWAVGDIANDFQLKHVANRKRPPPSGTSPTRPSSGSATTASYRRPCSAIRRWRRSGSANSRPRPKGSSTSLAGATTAVPPTGGRSSTRPRSPRCSSTPPRA